MITVCHTESKLCLLVSNKECIAMIYNHMANVKPPKCELHRKKYLVNGMDAACLMWLETLKMMMMTLDNTQTNLIANSLVSFSIVNELQKPRQYVQYNTIQYIRILLTVRGGLVIGLGCGRGRSTNCTRCSVPSEPTIAGLAVWVGAASKTNGGTASCGWMGASATTGAVLACVHSKNFLKSCIGLYTQYTLISKDCVCEHAQYTLIQGMSLRGYTIYTYARAVFASTHNIHLCKGCVC